MQAIVETEPYLRAALSAGLREDDREAIIALVADNPTSGDVIVGTGGCRKLRVAGRGKGKSGGYRVITFYSGPHVPVFLLTVFSKGERSDLTKAECNRLASLTATLVDSLGKSWWSRSMM